MTRSWGNYESERHPIRRHAMERAASRPELVERPIIYGICHLRPARVQVASPGPSTSCRWVGRVYDLPVSPRTNAPAIVDCALA